MPRLIASAVLAVLLITVFAPAGGPVPAAAQSPDVEVAADAIIVDELGAGFIPRGAGWRDGEGGYDDHHYWQRAVSAPTGRVGTWRVTLPEAGPYRVEAMVPLRHATTKAARYLIGTADGVVIRTANQSRTRGTWVSLGTYELGATAEVRLSARTADARVGRLVAFDALRFVSVAAPPPPPDPPVISNLDVVPTDTTAVVRFSLDAPGPARTEYRAASAINWLLGAEETTSKYADHRQVIRGLDPETAYELRVIATNAGGRTVSDTVRFTTQPPSPPVIRNVAVAPEDTRAVVTFSLDRAGPARSEFRESGDATWTLGAEETTSKYVDHRQVINGLRPETAYELRVIATNAGGRTVSDTVAFRTLPRTVHCDAGESFTQALNQARSGDTIIIKGTCSGNFVAGWSDGRLTLRGDGGRLVGAAGSADPVLTTRGVASVRSLVIAGGDRVGLLNELGDLTVTDSTIRGNGWHGVQTNGGNLSMRGSTVLANAGPGLFAGGSVSEGSVDISESTFSDNDGAGIVNRYVTRVADSLISGNGGAGISNDSTLSGRGVLTVVSSTIADNRSSGLLNSYQAEVRSTTIQRNRTTRVGGGIANFACGIGDFGLLTLIDSVVNNNTASDGGGIYHEDDSGSSLDIQSSVITANSPNNMVTVTCTP